MSEEEKPLDVGDAASVKDAKKEAKSEAMREKETVLGFLSTEGGRKYFWEFLVRCHIYQNPFSSDPLRMAQNCGEMNIGQQVLIQIENASPELYLQMVKENRKTK